MRVSGIRARVMARTGIDSTDQGLATNVLNDFINEANLQIADVHDWPWRITQTTFPTIAGVGTYTLPANHLRTRTLKIAQARPMAQRNLLDLETLFYDDQAVGQPTDYALEGAELLLRAVPDAIYNVSHRYLMFEPALTQDQDEPLMPEQFQTSIVELASALAFRRIGNFEAAAVAQAAFEGWLLKMHDKVRRSRQTVVPSVRPGAWENV